MLVINPDECIDCGVCIPECPIDAIVTDIDPRAEPYLQLNRDYSMGKWPNITKKKPGMENAKAYDNAPGKMMYFSPEPGEGD
jgi:ferredoxin